MSVDLNDAFHWGFGRGFWYANPAGEIKGLTEDHLYWSPAPRVQCALWHVGHIAHRECVHLKCLLEGKLAKDVIPEEHSIFFESAYESHEFRESCPEPDRVLDWSKKVRQESHEFIAGLTPEQYNEVPASSPEGNSIARVLIQTIAHTGLHIGRIQLLRMLMKDIKV